MKQFDPSWLELLLSIGGFVTGSIALLISILQYRREGRQNIIVELKSFVEYDTQRSIGRRFIVIHVVNDSYRDKFIHRPCFELQKVINGAKYRLINTPNRTENIQPYPKKVDVGDQVIEILNVTDFRSILGGVTVKRIRAVAELTNGQTFKSRWVNIKKLLGHDL